MTTRMYVEMSHTIDDLEKERARLARSARWSVRLLEDALHALRDDRTAVTEDFIERVIVDLQSALTKEDE